MAGIEGTPVLATDYFAQYMAPDNGAIAESDYTDYGFPFNLDSEGGLRAIAGAPGSPASYGSGPQPQPSLWSLGGDMATMTLDGSLGGSALPVAGERGSGIGAASVDESMGSNMSRAVLLPDGGPDWGKIVMIIGVVVTLYVIGREMGRKGPVQ